MTAAESAAYAESIGLTGLLALAYRMGALESRVLLATPTTTAPERTPPAK